MATIAQSAVLVPSGAAVDLRQFDHHPGETSAESTADGTTGTSARRDDAAHYPHHAEVAVQGPTGPFHDMASILDTYATLGFQASHLGQAVALAKKMITPQPPSTIFTIKDGEFVKVEPDAADAAEEAALVYPTLFLGITATLLGTGCREAVRFLVQEGIAPRDNPHAGGLSSTEVNFTALKREFGRYAREKLRNLAKRQTRKDADDLSPVGHCRSFLSAVVCSGGGPEHDLRRACQAYVIADYASEQRVKPKQSGRQKKVPPPPSATETPAASGDQDTQTMPNASRFGNVLYKESHPRRAQPRSARQRRAGALGGKAPTTTDTDLFDLVVEKLAELLHCRQQDLQKAYNERPEQERKNASLDGTAYCAWAVTPSEVWALAGLWLTDVLESALMDLDDRQRAESQPGELTGAKAAEPARESLRRVAVRQARETVLYWAARQEVPIFCPSFADGDFAQALLRYADAAPEQRTLLKLDLVRDIHGINKLAMYSKRTGMLICGGGSVKHHVCNANLMRNGADYTVFMSNGQEFDGSDAGARPEEAVSWGKIRCDGEAVKVYSEVTVVLPLLVTSVFVPAVRQRNAAASHAGTQGQEPAAGESSAASK